MRSLRTQQNTGGKDGARVRRTGGRSDFVGHDDRDRTGEVSTRLIHEHEDLHPAWREKRLRLESRPGFNELRRLLREADEPFRVAGPRRGFRSTPVAPAI